MSVRKVYVGVLIRIDEHGKNYPVKIFFEDGKTYEIDRTTDIRRACAMKVGGTAIRYTVVIGGRTTYLFEDEGRWFVEAN